MAAAGEKIPDVVVVMVPLPAQGHLNQLLHLSRRISAYGIPVHYVGTATHNRQAMARVHGWHPTELSNLHFHGFPTPPFLSPTPVTTVANKFPGHLIPSFQATCTHLRDPLTRLLRSLSSQARRVVVIHDSLMAATVDEIDSVPNAESYIFHPISAFTTLLYELEDREGVEGNDDSIPKDLEIPSLEGCFTPEFWDFVGCQFSVPQKHSGCLYNTCRVIEKPFLETLQRLNLEVKHWAVGPFNPVKKLGPRPNHPCLEWLDRQEPNSVIYVSFGTTTSMVDEEIRELAAGLEKSEQKFIWVLRDVDRGDVFDGRERKCEVGEEGYEERVGGRGMVVRDWAPQLEIIRHSATGGFMSHCGWNSCMESITMGVPVAAWPMHSDQPRNAVLMTEVLKVGVAVREWARHEEVVTAAEVEKAVRKLMASEEGSQIRKRAEEIGDAVRLAVEDGGQSRVELDSFIAHITR